LSQNQEQHSYKRVVLLFKLQSDNGDIIRAFLRHSHLPESEYEEHKHYTHLDPERWERDYTRYTAHIVIDMNEGSIKSPDVSTLPHEIYKVKLSESGDL
jgi:hypothetical protein